MLSAPVMFQRGCAGAYIFIRAGGVSMATSAPPLPLEKMIARLALRASYGNAAKQMVTDDPEGITFWKVTNGIRMTGMPGFQKTLSDTERWQLTMLLAHADALPAPVAASLSR
jgi:hypothetical protein